MAVEFTWNTLPVSTSVTMMWYLLMTPLWWSDGGADQERKRVVESSATADRFLGAWDGAKDAKQSRQSV